MKFFDRFLVDWIFITTIIYIIFGITFLSFEKTNFSDNLLIILTLWFLTNIIPFLIIRYRLKNNLLYSYQIKDWFKLLLPSERKARAIEKEKLAKKVFLSLIHKIMNMKMHIGCRQMGVCIPVTFDSVCWHTDLVIYRRVR